MMPSSATETEGEPTPAALPPPLPRPLRIYLARHGQDEDNAAGILNGRRDEPLTSIGVGQARTVAAEIRSEGLTFDAVYASPLQRAHRTAEIIVREGLDGLPGPIRSDDELVERDFGVLTGTPTSEIAERCGEDGVLRTSTITYFLSPKGAETFPDLLVRAGRVLKRMSEEWQQKGGGTILLVTHGDFGKMLYASYYGLEWEDVLRKFHFGNSEVLLLSEDSSPGEAHVFKIEQHNH